MMVDSSYMSTPRSDVGSRSGRIWTDHQQRQSGPLIDDAIEVFSENLYLENLRTSIRVQDTSSRARRAYDQ